MNSPAHSLDLFSFLPKAGGSRDGIQGCDSRFYWAIGLPKSTLDIVMGADEDEVGLPAAGVLILGLGANYLLYLMPTGDGNTPSELRGP